MTPRARTRPSTRRCLAAVVALVGLSAAACTPRGGNDDNDAAAPPSTIASLRSDGSTGTTTDTDTGNASIPPTSEPRGAAATDYPRVELRWTPCEEAELDGLDCATFEVPLDHRAPNGDTITLALSRREADGRPIGSLVLNPGGPGAAGRELASQLQAVLSEEILEQFDLVGFDPRGVGASTPVRCADASTRDRLGTLDGDPDTPAEETAYARATATFTEGCVERHGDLLPHLGTENAARDLDRIRAALGDEKLTYLGYSYGTELGATYATLFPDRIRAMVLDGAVRPGGEPEDFALEQAKGFEVAFDNFVAACAADAACAARPDANAVYQTVRAAVEAAPIPVDEPGERRSLTVGGFQTGVVQALYDETLWTFLARGLVEAANGNGATLLALADLYNDRAPDGTYSNVSDANTAISCADDGERFTVEQARTFATQFAAASPRFGAQLGWMSLGCTGMPAPARPPVTIGAATAPPILVIGTVGDPATPYAWAAELAAVLGPATVLTWEGQGHTAYPKTDCISAAVDAYLLQRTVPAAGTRCPAGDADDGGPFNALRDELRSAFEGSGLDDAVVACMAERLAAEITIRELTASETADLPPSLQRKVTGAATSCALRPGGS